MTNTTLYFHKAQAVIIPPWYSFKHYICDCLGSSQSCIVHKCCSRFKSGKKKKKRDITSIKATHADLADRGETLTS